MLLLQRVFQEASNFSLVHLRTMHDYLEERSEVGKGSGLRDYKKKKSTSVSGVLIFEWVLIFQNFVVMVSIYSTGTYTRECTVVHLNYPYQWWTIGEDIFTNQVINTPHAHAQAGVM